MQRSIKTRLYPKIYEVKTCTGRKHFVKLISYEIAVDAVGAEYVKDAVWWLYRDIKSLTKANISTVSVVPLKIYARSHLDIADLAICPLACRTLVSRLPRLKFHNLVCHLPFEVFVQFELASAGYPHVTCLGFFSMSNVKERGLRAL